AVASSPHPWHYTVEAMLQDSKGVLHIPPPEVKEQLHHIPTGTPPRLLGLLVMATWAKPVVLGEGLDEDRHWAAAARMKHSLVGWPTLEPALEAILEFRREWRHDLVRIRRDVLRELQEMVEDAADDTDAWLATLPDHVRATYVTEDRPRPFQGLVLDRLLRGVGYPAADDLQQDVNAGFDMLGPVRPAPGWRPRSDERYARPEGLDRLRRENPLY
ncbi:PUB3, partial [Symbiodinium necroappetens]